MPPQDQWIPLEIGKGGGGCCLVDKGCRGPGMSASEVFETVWIVGNINRLVNGAASESEVSRCSGEKKNFRKPAKLQDRPSVIGIT